MRWLVTAAVLLMSTSLAMADLVYLDDFDGASSTRLQGTTPDVSVGDNTWLADTDFTADGGRGERSGSMDGGGNATLAFAPQSGFRYTLDVSLRNVNGQTQWWGFGFTDRQDRNPTREEFNNANFNLGRAWSIVRGNQTNPPSDVIVPNSAYQDGQDIATAWTSFNDADGTSRDIDVRIVLDTSSALWSAQHFARSPLDESFTLVASQPTISNQSTIDAVGFAVSSNIDAIDGRIASFQLDAVAVPEPSSLVLFAFVGIGCLFRAHRRTR